MRLSEGEILLYYLPEQTSIRMVVEYSEEIFGMNQVAGSIAITVRFQSLIVCKAEGKTPFCGWIIWPI